MSNSIIPNGMELRYIELNNIYPTNIYTPLEIRMKYQWLLVRTDLPPIKYIRVGNDKPTYHLSYKPESTFYLDNLGGIYSHGATIEEVIFQVNV